uniref:G-protein coupled receptors family 1 profile domain-containing protein n=1 Tax=Romanomermis culicivorax TaxID=13658 RepID=A0A915IMA0_ROMCU
MYEFLAFSIDVERMIAIRCPAFFSRSNGKHAVIVISCCSMASVITMSTTVIDNNLYDQTDYSFYVWMGVPASIAFVSVSMSFLFLSLVFYGYSILLIKKKVATVLESGLDTAARMSNQLLKSIKLLVIIILMYNVTRVLTAGAFTYLQILFPSSSVRLWLYFFILEQVGKVVESIYIIRAQDWTKEYFQAILVSMKRIVHGDVLTTPITH